MALYSGLNVFGSAGSHPDRLPPKAAHSEVRIVERVAQHRLVQTFVNMSSSPLETSYVFPLMDGAAVSGFRAKFSSGRDIHGEVRKRNMAKQAFNAAVSLGLRAAMLEECGDVFRTSLGTFGAGEEVEVELQFVLELPFVDGTIRLTIPSHVAPRYSPPGCFNFTNSSILAYNSTAPEAQFTASVLIEMGAAGVGAIESPTHPSMSIKRSYNGIEAIAELKTVGLENDLVLVVQPTSIFSPVVARELLETNGTEALMLSLVPQFETAAQKIEAIFILDCSGSMRGRRMEQAKRATNIFLRSLPADCFFNIVLFGSSFKALYTQGSVVYDEASLEKATAFVEAISANMGGTEILAPLRFVLDAEPKMQEMQRQVFLLTDGQVSNQFQVIDLCKSKRSRVFSIGIGSGVSTALVTGVARATNGSAEFVQDNEKLEPVCIAMLKKASSLAISDICISWPSTGAFRSQTKPPPIFAGSGFSGFSLYPSGAVPENTVVKLTGTAPAGPLEFVVPIPAKAKVVNNSNEAILHKMFARSVIRDVEEIERALQCSEQSLKTEAIQFSIQHSVLCSFTAFVAVEQGGTPMEHDVQVLRREFSHDALADQRALLFGCRKSCSPQAGTRALFAADTSALPELEAATSWLKCVSRDIESCLIQQSQQLDELSCRSANLSLTSCMFQRKSSLHHAAGVVARCRSVCVTGVSAVWNGVSAVFSRYASMFARASIPDNRFAEVRHVSPPVPNATTASTTVQAVASLKESPMQKHTSVPPAYPPSTVAASTMQGNTRHSSLASLEKLLRLAAFNGSFACSAELRALTGIEQQAVETWATEQWSTPVDSDVLVTALVLSFLTHDFAGQRTTWELVGYKAMEWLQAQNQQWSCASINSVESLLAMAASRLA